jgi:hypothetical protein
MLTRYWLCSEPLGASYAALIREASHLSVKFSLVLPSRVQFSKACYDFLKQIENNLICVTDETEWPGTRLMAGETARIYWYRLDPSITDTIGSAVKKLYDWNSPDFPEDPAFYRHDGAVLLGTSSHERFSFLNLSEVEFFAFAEKVRDVKLSLSPPLFEV